jgi:hypothetical protein
MQPCHHNVPVGWNGNAINYVFDDRPAVTGKAKSRVGEGRVRAAGRGKPKHLSGKAVITGGTNRDLCGKKVISVRLENTGSAKLSCVTFWGVSKQIQSLLKVSCFFNCVSPAWRR